MLGVTVLHYLIRKYSSCAQILYSFKSCCSLEFEHEYQQHSLTWEYNQPPGEHRAGRGTESVTWDCT